MDPDLSGQNMRHKSLVRFVIERISDNALGFFFDWFVALPGSYASAVARGFNDWEKSWALVVTAKYWLKPMWQDFSLPGYIIGFFLRTFRIILAVLFYFFYFLLALVGIIVWYLIPLGMGYLIFKNILLL